MSIKKNPKCFPPGLPHQRVNTWGKSWIPPLPALQSVHTSPICFPDTPKIRLVLPRHSELKSKPSLPPAQTPTETSTWHPAFCLFCKIQAVLGVFCRIEIRTCYSKTPDSQGTPLPPGLPILSVRDIELLSHWTASPFPDVMVHFSQQSGWAMVPRYGQTLSEHLYEGDLGWLVGSFSCSIFFWLVPMNFDGEFYCGMFVHAHNIILSVSLPISSPYPSLLLTPYSAPVVS